MSSMSSIGMPAIPLEQSPLARILRHEHDYWRTIASVKERDGWRLYHNAGLLPRIDPNHAGDFRAPEGSGATVVADIIAFYAELGATPAAYVDYLATPRDLPEQLQAAGFDEWIGATNDLMIYVGPDSAFPAHAWIELVRTDTQREEWASIVDEESDKTTRSLLRALYLQEIGDARMTAYLARVDGHAGSRCELFACNGLGRVEAVRTLVAYRGRGLATALVRQAVHDSLGQGNAITYIYAEPGGDAQRLYERLGFRTVTRNVTRSFTRR